MKKGSVFAAASLLLLAACAEKPGYQIAGTVDRADAEGKYVYLAKYGVDEAPLDSALIKNGTFSFKGEQVTPLLCILWIGEDELKRGNAGENQPFTALFTLENAKLQAVLNEQAPAVTGTPENDAFKALQDQLKGIRAAEEALAADMKSADEAVKNAAAEKAEEIEKAAGEVVKTYVLANVDKQVAAKVFFDARYDLSEADRRAIVEKASEAFKAVPGVNKVIDHLKVLENSAVGKSFLDFEMADVNGQTRKLSDYVGKGKVVLVDFWASWCGPCRREMPNIVEAYKQYKGKKFEIVGVSLDKDAESWKAAIQKLGITWPQMSDLKYWDCEGSRIYAVSSIPHTMIIDGEGTIVARGLHGEELQAKLAELLK